MKKKLLVVLSLFLVVFTLTGCLFGPRTAATAEKFKSVANNNNLTIIDAYDQMEQYGTINSATIAKSSEGWQVEFYVLKTESDAIDMYNTNKKLFENLKGSSNNKEKTIDIKNYTMYNLITGGRYMYLARIDNTLLYAKVDEQYAKDVQKIVKELGY